MYRYKFPGKAHLKDFLSILYIQNLRIVNQVEPSAKNPYAYKKTFNPASNYLFKVNDEKNPAMFKVHNKDKRKTSMKSLYCPYY